MEKLLRELDLGEWIMSTDQPDKLLAARTALPKRNYCSNGNGRLSQGEF